MEEQITSIIQQGLGTLNITANWPDLGSAERHSIFNYYKMIDATKRMETFKYWPKSIKQRKDEMVEAGFFYTGKGDHVFCFSCRKGLHNWEEDVIPWVEHAKWSRDCTYMISVKGQEFVDDVQKELLKDKAKLACPTSRNGNSSDEKKCKICFEKQVEVTLDPCGHCFCKSCSFQFLNCPICRLRINKRINTVIP